MDAGRVGRHSFLFHRASAAFLACSERWRAVSFAALAGPPAKPPSLLHRLGAYNVGPDDAASAAATGVTVAVTDYPAPRSPAAAAFRRSGVVIIDQTVER